MRRSSHFLNFAGFVMSVAMIGCGGSQPAPASAGEPGTAPASEGSGEGSAEVWSDTMSLKLKGEFMKKKVVPAMSKTFQDFDAKKYADFGCKTCHGPQFKPHPVDFLPELTVKNGELSVPEDEAALAKFMGEKVSPQMAELFGKKPFDPATKEGFGCNGCHKINM